MFHFSKVVLLEVQSGKASLGEAMYQIITAEMISIEDIFLSFNFKNEHSVLDTLNKLESTVLAWKQRISEESNKRSPKRYQWYFTKESPSEAEKCALYIERVEALLHLLKSRFPNLPQTFMDVIRVQYNTVRCALCKYAFCSFFLLLTYKIIANFCFPHHNTKRFCCIVIYY